MSMICVNQISSYEQEKVNAVVKKQMEQFSLAEKLNPTMHVVIKPNLLMKRKPEEFTTTHPSLVEAVIIWLKSIGIQHITIADSPGGLYTVPALKGIYDTCGMTDVAKRQGVNLNEDVSFQTVANETGKLVKSFTLISPICNADFIIDVCKLKTHAMTGLSGGVKNLFGTIPGLMKPEFHWRFPDKANFCEMLLDLCETVKPDFVLVDAVEAMEGDGPSGGTIRKAGLILSSTQPYDLDYYLCHIIGAEPSTILTVKSSIERGLCCGDKSKLTIIGEEKAEEPFAMPHDKELDFMSHVPSFLRPTLKAITLRFFTSKPIIQTDKCIGCGKCAESCPAKTIVIENRKAQIEYNECIRCFCCHEMCPIKVIDIKRSRLFR